MGPCLNLLDNSVPKSASGWNPVSTRRRVTPLPRKAAPPAFAGSRVMAAIFFGGWATLPLPIGTFYNGYNAVEGHLHGILWAGGGLIKKKSPRRPNLPRITDITKPI